jgi:hypothetical protein
MSQNAHARLSPAGGPTVARHGRDNELPRFRDKGGVVGISLGGSGVDPGSLQF